MRSHRRLFVVGLALPLVLACGIPSAMAQTVTLGRDYDLVTDEGLVHYSQKDSRWAYYSVRGDPTISMYECGCLLSAFATVINHEGSGMSPWFVTRFDFFGGSDSAFDFNPRYLDVFLNFGFNPSGDPSRPAQSFPPGWGYKRRDAGTCGVIPLTQALQLVGTDGLGSAVGFTPVLHEGFGPDVKNIVNRNLIAGRPTIAAVRIGDADKANHAVLIAGWDNDLQAYRILDPKFPRLGIHGPNLPFVPIATDPDDPPNEATYDKYEMRIEGIIEMRRGGFSLTPSFVFGDDPSPIEILMTGPDGRRTGIDPEISASFQDNDGASYWTFGSWSDPLNEIPEGLAPRFIMYPNAPAGLYHFKVTGIADGPLDLDAETLFGGTRVMVGSFHGTIAVGEVRKYELQFSHGDASTIAQVSNFTPHAFAGDDITGRTDTPIAFDGRRSFDVDGTLASYTWDFGDGGTGEGAQTQHIYLTPGIYTVTLTVTDADGATATDSLRASVILSQRRPVANVSGPYLGFAARGVTLDGNRSSDPNGDALTYRWDFGDRTPVVTTTLNYVFHTYANIGVYTARLIVNDGLDDSEPATARVEIVQAPEPASFPPNAMLS
jgi:hypothetical protein